MTAPINSIRSYYDVHAVRRAREQVVERMNQAAFAALAHPQARSQIHPQAIRAPQAGFGAQSAFARDHARY